ncbi:MAG: hypothetical protein BGO10_08310 [Chlamydia sp. 32-24]|nr:MAG: hypothetical protein BGO10_08310 [Chlamydia sp. 32-24]
MNKICLFLSIFLGFFNSPILGVAIDRQIDTIYALILIKDLEGACKEGERAILENPDSLEAKKAYFKALTVAGKEEAAYQTFKVYQDLFPVEQKNEILEWMSWCIIHQSFQSPAPVVKAISLLAAYFSQDSRGIEIIHQALFDTNVYIRALALQLSETLRDEKIKNDLLVLLQTEKNNNVRIPLIQTIEKLKIKEAIPDLIKIISQKFSWNEEKVEAVKAITLMSEKPSHLQIKTFANNSRSGLRVLASEMILYFNLVNEKETLRFLLQDTHAEVRENAIQAIGCLKIADLKSDLIAKLKDANYHVAIKAAWALTILNDKSGHELLKKRCFSKNLDERLFAVGAVNSTGTYGHSLAKEIFFNANDPYVRMNLAIGFLHQMEMVDLSCQELYLNLTNSEEKWMWEERGNFKYLAPNKLKQNPLIPGYPETVNLVTKLEILNILAIFKHPLAQEGMKKFLEEKSWGVSGLASALLLTEGDDNMIDLLKQFLNHENFQVQIQVALILAQWGKEEIALKTLQNSYYKVDKNTKERILEGILQVASPKSIPFLIQQLNDPHPTLRVIAAVALLNCLNH